MMAGEGARNRATVLAEKLGRLTPLQAYDGSQIVKRRLQV
jgi:hypothetical protein